MQAYIIDIAVFVVLLLPALAGIVYGFLNVLLSIIAWAVALGVSLKLTGYVAPVFSSVIQTEIIRVALAFILLFITSLILLTAVGYFMLKLLRRSGLSAADRILGLFFGFGLGAFVVFVTIFLAGFTGVTGTQWWQQSLLVGPFEKTAVWARQFIPESLAKYHHYSSEDPLTD